MDAFGEQLDHAQLPGPVHVRTAAQLAGVVADLHHPDRVAVPLAEQRHGAILRASSSVVTNARTSWSSSSTALTSSSTSASTEAVPPRPAR